MLAVLCMPAAWADSTNTFHVFDSPSMNRVVHGEERNLDLSDGGLKLGHASAFFGVDDLSNSSQHFLASGVQWRSGQQTSPFRVSVGAMQTAARGSAIGSQTLMRAESQLDLTDRWFLPALSLESDQFSSAALAGDAQRGQATEVGLTRAGARGGYRLGYFRAGQHFDAWGSSLTPGDRGVEFSGHYRLAQRLRFSNSLRMHEGDTRTGTAHGLVDRWSLALPRRGQTGHRPWQFSGQVGDAGTLADGATPLSLNLAAPVGNWRDWQVDSSLGWYRGDIDTPDGLPIEGALWRLSVDRGVRLAGLRAFIRPNLAVGGARNTADTLASRAGLGLMFPGMLDHVAFDVAYASAGWSSLSNHGDMRMMLSFRQNAGAVMPPLRSLWGHMR